MSVEFFLDTNVFVYSFDPSAPAKRDRSVELIETALETGAGVTGWQVVQEFLNVALHRFEQPLSAREASEYLGDVLAPLCRVFPSSELARDALAIHTETGFRFYDALVVAGAVAAGAKILYTEDLQSGRRLRGVEIRNPFA